MPLQLFLGVDIPDSPQVLAVIERVFVDRGLVTEHHSTNVNAFSALIKIFNSEWNYYIKHQRNSREAYLFYDTVHRMKKIRNNLLNKKKVVFPWFFYDDNLHINPSPPVRVWKLYWCFNKKINLIVSICPGLEREGLKSVVRQAIFAGVYDMRRARNWKVTWEKTGNYVI